MSTYYERYSREMARANAMRMMLAAQGRSDGPSAIARRVALGGKNKWSYAGSGIGPAPLPKEDEHGFFGDAIRLPGKAFGKVLDTSPARAVLDVLSRGTYASANWSKEFNREQKAALQSMKNRGGGNASDEILSWFAPLTHSGVYREAWEGLKGEDKTTYSEVLRENHPGMGNKSAGAAGFALDVVGDPLNLIPIGAIASGTGKVVKAGAKATRIAKPEEVIAESIAKGEPLGKEQADVVQKILEDSKSAEAPKTPAPLQIEPRDVTATADASQITDALKGAPTLKYPDQDLIRQIPAPFTEVDETLPVATKGAKTPEQQDMLAKLRATKAALLQDESRRIGRHTVGELLTLAKKSDEFAAHAEKLINAEVKRMVKTGDDLPETAQLFGKSGEKAAFGLTLDQMTKLLRDGEIGGAAKYGAEGTDEFLSQFPIHSADDLESVFVNNAKGQRVSLGQYLRDLGVQVKAASQKGELSFLKGFDGPESIISPKTVTATVKKEKAYGPGEMASWIASYGDRVDAEDLAKLKGAKTKAEFAKVLDEISKATVAADFENVPQLLEALEKGLTSKAFTEAILKKMGVKTTDELRQKVNTILNAAKKGTGPKPATKAAARKPAVERILGRVDPDDFGSAVTKAEDVIDRGIDVPNELPKLNPDQLKDLAAALPEAVLKNLVDPADLAKYPFLTDIKKTRRTHASPGTGKGRNLHGWNGYSQSDIFRGIIKSATKRYPIPNVKGREAFKAWRQRASALYDDVMPTLAAAEAALRRENVKLISGSDNAGIMLSLSDVLESLPRALVERHLFNPRTSVYPTDFLTAADGIVRSLMKSVPLNVARENARVIFANSPKIRTLKDRDKIAQTLASALVDASDIIAQRVELNYARHGIEVGKAVKSMTDDVIKNVVGKYANPDVSAGEALGDFAAREGEISAAGRAIDAPTEAYGEARAAADAQLGSVLQPGDFAEGKSAKEFSKVADEQAATKVGAQQAASRTEEGLDLIPPTVDLGDRYNAGLQSNLFRANVPLLDKATTVKDALGRAFVSSYGHADLHEALRVERSVTQDFSRAHRTLIAALHDSILEAAGPNAKAMTIEAFKYLQEGKAPADEVMRGIMDGLKSSLDITFGARADGLGSFAQRNGIFATHLNEVMDYYKVDRRFRFDGAKPFMEQMEDWKKWEDVSDPLSLLDGLHASMQRASVEVTLGRDFSNQFGRATVAPGYVKIKNSGNKSRMGRFINKDLYYPQEIASQLRYLDDVLTGSLGRIKDPNAAAIVGMYDRIIHAWKSGLTIYRPGHHVRNLIGDVTLAFFDGVTNPAVYKKAASVLATRSKAYDGWDGLKALEEGGSVAGGETSRVSVRIGGKKKPFTDDEIYRAAYNQGIIPDYRTLEDIAFNVEQGMPSATNKASIKRPLGGRGQRVAGGISQARDHWIRIAHFVDVLQKGNFKTAEEAFAHAGQRVRKWHPDGSDLTNFENKIMRRSFMFYSWMRKAIPLVVETLVMKPGKAMVFPKAMYNFAIANGVDPESLGNPFPVDQLFPEFITDQVIGPQFGEAGDYGGINPGEPVTEMMSQWGSSDPQHALLGAMSPVGRIPIELATGTNLGTGSSILDKSDYADSQIPGAGYLAKITGSSVTGLGQPIKDVQRGNTEGGFNQDAFINFLTGLGIRDYSKPNYIRRAQLEQRDKAREAYRSRNG